MARQKYNLTLFFQAYRQFYSHLVPIFVALAVGFETSVFQIDNVVVALCARRLSDTVVGNHDFPFKIFHNYNFG
jgi:hypothetical protein